MRPTNALELTVQNLVEAKLLNLDVSLGSIVQAGSLAGEDPWDVFCGNGWIVRRRHLDISAILPSEVDTIRAIVQQELKLEQARRG